MSCSGCIYALKTAIFLNNAAVNMMHVGSFDEAFLTLKNCLALMRVVAVASRYGHFPAEFLSGREIEEFMKVPVKVTRNEIADNRAKEHINCAFEVKTVSSQQDPADFCFQTNVRTTFCFILIEETNFEESEDILRDEIELCSNLMVYNFGLVHCIFPVDGTLKSGNNEEWCVREMRQRGFHLLSSCENLFNARLCKGDPLHFQQSTVLLASVLLTQAQIQICRDFYYAAELSRYYLDALQTLLLAIKLYKEFLPILPNFAAKAA